jgi:pimeloyl-ACP methyl ester carboxylesterase
MNFVRPATRFAQRRLRTGVTLQCAEAGPADTGEAVLFLHGYGDCWLSAAPLMARVPASWRVLAPDQRGHGRSERPESGYDITTLAEDAAALLEAADFPRATVIGHSMGSFVAQRLAIDHPERVARLVLVGGSPHCAGPAVREVQATLQGFGEEIPRDFVVAFQESAVARPLPPDFLEALVAESCRIPTRVWRALVADFMRFDTRLALGKIAVPTWLVWGDADGFFGRADQELLHAGIAGSRLSVYEGTGHCPNWEEPDRFARELAAFVAEGAQLGGGAGR